MIVKIVHIVWFEKFGFDIIVLLVGVCVSIFFGYQIHCFRMVHLNYVDMRYKNDTRGILN